MLSVSLKVIILSKKKCSDIHKVSKIIIATLYQINKIIDIRKMSQPLPCKLKSQQQQCTH